MVRTRRPWITAGVALTGACLIAITPVAPPLPDVQQRAVQLASVPWVDWSELVTNTEANWTGLEEMFNQTTNLFTLPSSVWEDGIGTVLTDLLEFKELWDPFGDALMNPLSLLGLPLELIFGSTYAFNAAIDATGGVFTDLAESIASFNFTNIWNDLVDGPSTIINAFLNGYPVAAVSADPAVGTDYTLNAPSDLITPEFGLLTNPDASTTPYPGDVPLITGTLASFLQVDQTLADELQTVAGVAPAPVDVPPAELGTSATLGINWQNIWDDTGIPNSFSFAGLCFGLFSDSCGGAATFSLDLPESSSYSLPLGDLSLPGATVPAYVNDLSQTAEALLGSIGPLAAPSAGTVGTEEIGNLLAADPTINLAGAISPSIVALLTTLAAPIDALLSPILGPLTSAVGTFVTNALENGFIAEGSAPVDLTTLLSESLQLLFTAL